MKPERERQLLLAVLVVGLLVRLTHLWTIAGTAFPKFPLIYTVSDTYTFWEWARTIVAGDWLGRDTYHPSFEWMKAIASQETWYRWWGGKAIFQQAPLYPYLVAVLLAVSHKSLLFVSAVQLIVGAFQPLVMFWLGRRLFDGRVGVVAAALTALYGPFVFHEGTLLRDWLPPIVEPLALLALLKARESGRSLDWCLAGVGLGVALLTREAILVFLPIALFWLATSYWGAVRQTATSATALLLGFVLMLSPLMSRNALVGAPLLALSNRAGEAFIVGNAADAFPIGLRHPPSMKGILERSDGRLAAVIQETLQTYHGDWYRLGSLILLRLRALADPLEVPNNLNFYYGVEISPILRFTLRYGIIFPLGLGGFVLSLSQWRRHQLLILYGISTVVGLAATTIVARYRLALVPVLIIYGAMGLVWLLDAVRTSQPLKVAAYVALLVGFVSIQQLLVPIPMLRERDDIVIHRPEYLLSATVYAHDGEFDRALAEIDHLEAKAKTRPSFAELAREASFYEGDFRAMWASRLLQEGKIEEAKRQLERAEVGYGARPELSYPLWNLGFLYLKAGETAKARAYLERFLTLDPNGAQADQARRVLGRLKE